VVSGKLCWACRSCWHATRAKLGTDSGVPLLSALQLCDGLGPRVPQPSRSVQPRWIILNGAPRWNSILRLLSRSWPRACAWRRRPQKDRQQRDSGEEHVAKAAGRIARSGCGCITTSNAARRSSRRRHLLQRLHVCVCRARPSVTSRRRVVVRSSHHVCVGSWRPLCVQWNA